MPENFSAFDSFFVEEQPPPVVVPIETPAIGPDALLSAAGVTPQPVQPVSPGIPNISTNPSVDAGGGLDPESLARIFDLAPQGGEENIELGVTSTPQKSFLEESREKMAEIVEFMPPSVKALVGASEVGAEMLSSFVSMVGALPIATLDSLLRDDAAKFDERFLGLVRDGTIDPKTAVGKKLSEGVSKVFGPPIEFFTDAVDNYIKFKDEQDRLKGKPREDEGSRKAFEVVAKGSALLLGIARGKGPKVLKKSEVPGSVTSETGVKVNNILDLAESDLKVGQTAEAQNALNKAASILEKGEVSRKEAGILSKRAEALDRNFKIGETKSPISDTLNVIKEKIKSFLEKKQPVAKAGTPAEAPLARRQPVDPTVRKQNLQKNVNDRVQKLRLKLEKNPQADVAADIASLASAQKILSTLEGKGPEPVQPSIFKKEDTKPKPLEADEFVEQPLKKGPDELELDKGEKIGENIPERVERPDQPPPPVKPDPVLESQKNPLSKPKNAPIRERDPDIIPGQEKPILSQQTAKRPKAKNAPINEPDPDIKPSPEKPAEISKPEPVEKPVVKPDVKAPETIPEKPEAVEEPVTLAQDQPEKGAVPEPEPLPPEPKTDTLPVKRATKQPVPAIKGVAGKLVRLNQKDATGTFGVIKGDKFIGSHDALKGFAKNPRYTPGVQDREYGKADQLATQKGATAEGIDAFLDTYLQKDVTGDTGPAHMLNDGQSIFGTGRNATVDLIQANPELNKKFLDRLKTALTREFGFSAEDAARAMKVKNPKLVFIHDEFPATVGDFKKLARNKGQGFKKGTSAREDALDFAGQISDERIVDIGQMFGSLKKTPDTVVSLSQVIEKFGKEIVDGFVKDGAITATDGKIFFDETIVGGKTVARVSEQGKIKIKRALMSRLIDDPALIERMTPQLEQLALRIIPEMTKMRAAATQLDPTSTDISRHLVSAFKAVIDARSTVDPATGKKVTADEYLKFVREGDIGKQSGFFQETLNKADVIGRAEVLFRNMMGSAKPSLKYRLSEYTKGLDDIVSGQGALFESEKSPTELFEENFGEIPPTPEGTEVSTLISLLDNEVGIFDFEKFLGKRGKEQSPEYEAMRKAMADSPSHESILESREAAKELFKKTWPKRWASFQRAWLDRSGPMEREILKQGGEEGEKVIMKFHLARGADGPAMIETMKMERELFDNISDEELAWRETAVFARRDIAIAQYRDDVRNPNGITGEEALADLDRLREQAPEEFKKINDWADKYFSLMNKVLRDSFNEGFLTKADFEILNQTKDYARREFLDFIDPEFTYQIGNGKRISVTSNGISRLKQGSEGALQTDLELLGRKIITSFHARAFRNRANVVAAQMAQKFPENGIFKLLKKGEADPRRHTEIKYFVKGEKKSLWVSWDYAQQWVSQDPWVSQEAAGYIQMLSGTAILRATATGLNPAFALTNFPRDIIFTYFRARDFSPHLPIFFSQMSKDLAGTFKYLQTPKQFADDQFGGFSKEMVKRGMMVTFLVSEGMPGVVNVHPKLRAFGKYAEWLGFQSEMWVRLAISKRAVGNQMTKYKKEHGKFPAKGSEAMNDILDYGAFAGRSYLDFNGGGTMAKTVNHGIAYFNAGMIAMEGFRKSAFSDFKDQKKTAGVNRDFLTKAAWIGGLAGTFWAIQQMDENGQELMKRLRPEEKVANFIIPLPFMNRTDRNGATRHAYMKIAKSQEARPLITLYEGILNRMAAQYLKNQGKPFEHLMPDPDEMIAAAKSALAIVPGSSSVPPSMTAGIALFANFDTWREDKIWNPRDRKPVNPKAEVNYNTNPLLTLLANTKAGETVGLSPARTQVAIGKLIVPSNPFVMITGKMLEQMAFAAGQEKTSFEIRKDLADKVNHDLPFFNKLLHFSGTEEFAKKKEGEGIERFINTGKRLNRSKLETLLAKEEEHGNLNPVKDFIATVEDRQERFKLKDRAFDVRDRFKRRSRNPVQFVRQLGGLKATSDPKARAGKAAVLMRDMDAEQRKKFDKDMFNFKGITSKDFDFELKKLLKKQKR